jgi:hypothetical protein
MLNVLANVRFWGQSGQRPTAAYRSRFMSTRPRLLIACELNPHRLNLAVAQAIFFGLGSWALTLEPRQLSAGVLRGFKSYEVGFEIFVRKRHGESMPNIEFF